MNGFDILLTFVKVFPFSQHTLHNILETAPETWEGESYDEKSDVFSFAMILWRLFATKFQNEDSCLPQGDDPDDNVEDIDDSEYAYLQENGKFFPPPKQRETIRNVLVIYCYLIQFFKNLVGRKTTNSFQMCRFLKGFNSRLLAASTRIKTFF